MTGVQTCALPIYTLGLYHTLRDDWTSFHAPVPGGQQAPLYKAIGDLFREASRHRGLRHALALVYLEGRPPLRTYEGLRENLHLAWEKASSTPATLAPTLPTPAAREAWIAALIEDGKSTPEAWASAERRRDTLTYASGVVRATALAGLQAFGAYKKLDAPPPQKH